MRSTNSIVYTYTEYEHAHDTTLSTHYNVLLTTSANTVTANTIHVLYKTTARALAFGGRMAEDRVVLGGFDRNTQKLQVLLLTNALFLLTVAYF
jgi:hypothetical protein